MKKLLYLGALSAMILAACEEEKLKSEAIEIDFVDVNENKVEVGTKVVAKGIVSKFVTEEKYDFEFFLTIEDEEAAAYAIENYALANTKYGAEITVYGTYEGLNNLGVPAISATLVE
ncbi:MAG: hypothetical protein ABS939_18765 [Psychrobacillus sp.]